MELTLCVLFPLSSEGLPTHPVSGFHYNWNPGAVREPGPSKDPAQPLPEQFHLYHQPPAAELPGQWLS